MQIFLKAVFSTMQFNIKLMMILISIGIQALRVVFLITSSDQETSSPV